MDTLDQPLAFVDLETTGLHAGFDRITEVGIVTLSDGVLEEWSSLVDPGCRIPPAIEALTGITSAMVAGAPTFSALAATVLAQLDGRVFIAHNARFDYGFLKAEFARLDIRFQPKVLCTARLSRRLYPDFQRHNLDALIGRFGIDCAARHRALGDARVLVQWLAAVRADVAPEALLAAIAHQLAKPSLPPHLPAGMLEALPETPGVYVFHAEDGAPLYVGKSINLRTRVASHFRADLRQHKEMRLAQQVHSISHELCAGELSALLRESRLVKELTPVYNRRLRRARTLHALRWTGPLPPTRSQSGSGTAPELVVLDAGTPPDASDLFGIFRTRLHAKQALIAIADAEGLCRKRLGLEPGVQQDGPCFACQLGHCRGVCVGAEPALKHDLRLAAALATLRIPTWPFPGRIGIRESDLRADGTTLAEIHVFDHWRWCASARDRAALAAAWTAPPGDFDLDTYKILRRALERGGRYGLVEPPALALD